MFEDYRFPTTAEELSTLKCRNAADYVYRSIRVN